MKKLIIAGIAALSLTLTACGSGAQEYPKDQNRNVTSEFNNDWFCDGDVYVPQGNDFECWDDNDGHKKKKSSVSHSTYKRTTPVKPAVPAQPAKPATPAKPAAPAQPAKPAVPQPKQQTAPKSSSSGSSSGYKSSSSSSGSRSSSSSRK